MGGEDGVVGFNNRSGNLRSRIHRELQLGLLSVIHRQALHQEGGEARSSASAKGVEDEESLKTSALLRQLSDPVQDKVNNLLSNGVVTSCVVVGSILLASDQLLRVKELTVGSHADLINDSGLQVNKDSPGDMLATASLSKEGVERVIMASKGLVRRHLTIRLDSMLKAAKITFKIKNIESIWKVFFLLKKHMARHLLLHDSKNPDGRSLLIYIN
jgi:hypothetical protein